MVILPLVTTLAHRWTQHKAKREREKQARERQDITQQVKQEKNPPWYIPTGGEIDPNDKNYAFHMKWKKILAEERKQKRGSKRSSN